MRNGTFEESNPSLRELLTVCARSTRHHVGVRIFMSERKFAITLSQLSTGTLLSNDAL